MLILSISTRISLSGFALMGWTLALVQAGHQLDTKGVLINNLVTFRTPPFVGSYGVVPFPVKVVRKYIDLGELRIGDFESLGIFLFVEFSTYGQTCLGRRSGNELDDCAKTAQGFAAPVDADEREKPVLDFIPLAGSGRQVAPRDRELQFVGQFL